MEQDEKSSMPELAEENLPELAEEELQDVSGGFSFPGEAKAALGVGVSTGVVVGGVVGLMDRHAGTKNAILPAVGAGGVTGVAGAGVSAAIVAGAKKIARSGL